MKKFSLILGTALILLAGDGFCVNRDAASSSNQRYSDDENSQRNPTDTEQEVKCPYCEDTKEVVKNGRTGGKQRYLCKNCKRQFSLETDYSTNYDSATNQRRSEANRNTQERDACKYLEDILKTEGSLARKKLSKNRYRKIVAYYKYLGGTYKANKKKRFQYNIYREAALYLGFEVKTAKRALKALANKFDEIKAENIKEKANEVLRNAGSDRTEAITGLKNLGFSCLRIIELLGLEEDFNSYRKNQNIGSVSNDIRMNKAAGKSTRKIKSFNLEDLLADESPSVSSAQEHPSTSADNNSAEGIGASGSANNKVSTRLGQRSRSVDEYEKKFETVGRCCGRSRVSIYI